MSWGWQESYEMDGLASCLRKIFHNRRNHAVVNIGRQVKRTLVHLFLAFFVIFSLLRCTFGNFGPEKFQRLEQKRDRAAPADSSGAKRPFVG